MQTRPESTAQGTRDSSLPSLSPPAPSVETRRRQERRVRLLRQAGHLGNDRSGAAYGRAVSASELESAYRLVHDVYVEMGYIPKQQNGLRMRPYEFCPETATFVAKTPSRSIIGTISVIVDSEDLGLPSDKVFDAEIAAIRRGGRRVCEMSNQAVLKEFRRQGPAGELMRCALAYAVFEGQTDVICAVTPQLAPLYETLCFEQVGAVRRYSASTGDETVLMCLRDIHRRSEDPRYGTDALYRELVDYYYIENPHFRTMAAWKMLNQRLFSEEFAVAGLFGKCPEVVLDSRVRGALHRRLGNIFNLSQLAVTRAAEQAKCRKMSWQKGDPSSQDERRIHTFFGNRADIARPAAARPLRDSQPPSRDSRIPRLNG